MRLLRSSGLALALAILRVSGSSAQSLVFTSALPVSSSAAPVTAVAVVEERGLALWSGAESDFGAGVAVSGRGWTLRSIASVTTRPIDGRDRPTFEQIDVVRPVFARGSIAVAAGGGLRQEADGTRVYVGRVLAGTALGAGELQGSLVVERSASSPVSHDAADLITTVGWSRSVGRRIALGVEGIGQDLEGLWNPAEADGGAKLLVGPSIHARSGSGRWEASLTGGPVIRTLSTVSTSVSPAASSGRHFGLFASATWSPSAGR